MFRGTRSGFYKLNCSEALHVYTQIACPDNSLAGGSSRTNQPLIVFLTMYNFDR